jgi:hypothetical protein
MHCLMLIFEIYENAIILFGVFWNWIFMLHIMFLRFIFVEGESYSSFITFPFFHALVNGNFGLSSVFAKQAVLLWTILYVSRGAMCKFLYCYS